MTTKKTTLPVLIASLAASTMATRAAIIVAGWDTWDSTSAPAASVTAPDIAATAAASASTGTWSNSDSLGRGSSLDTTWGTFDGNGSAASSVTSLGIANFTVTNGRPSAEITFTITNNGTLDLDLSAFHMDVIAFRPNAPRTYALNVLAGSDITIGTVFASAGTPMNDNSTNDITQLGGGLNTDDADPTTHDQHEDLDLSLAGLADHTLSAGESAMIQIAFSNGTGSGGGHHLFLDNVALSGDFVPVPEPSSALLLTLSGFALFARRR